jgi:hypothetical protein
MKPSNIVSVAMAAHLRQGIFSEVSGNVAVSGVCMGDFVQQGASDD